MKERQPRLAVIKADSLHTAALSVDQGEQTLIYLYVCVCDDGPPRCKEVLTRRGKVIMIEAYSLSVVVLSPTFGSLKPEPDELETRPATLGSIWSSV